MLSQVQDGNEKIIEYYSKVLIKPERNYYVTRKGQMAIIISVLFPRVFVREIVYHKDLPCSIILANMVNESRETSHEVDEKTTAVRHRINADILPRKPCAECKHCKKGDECEGTVNI